MNAYEQKLANRRERLKAGAEKAKEASDAAYNKSAAATSGIPMGQPILVGHHSEQRHRNALARSQSAMRKSCDEANRAKELARKAAAVGTGGISSDDPAALDKLNAQLAAVTATQEYMKSVNKAIRSSKSPEKQFAALVALVGSEANAAKLLRPSAGGRVGFPSYMLSNNNANAKRIKARIEELQARSSESVEVETASYVYREDPEENRVMFEFQGKPSKDVREILKRFAFKWSPSRNAWVRQLTKAGIYAGQSVREALDALDNT